MVIYKVTITLYNGKKWTLNGILDVSIGTDDNTKYLVLTEAIGDRMKLRYDMEDVDEVRIKKYLMPIERRRN